MNTAQLLPGKDLAQVRKAFEDAYSEEPFIELLPQGQFPNTADLEFNNKVQIGLAVDESSGKVIVISAIDNLVKGTAGAALQSMNIALGLPEETGIAGVSK